MNDVGEIPVNPENHWRLQSPGIEGWKRSPRPGAQRKYFMISADTHITPPPSVIAARIGPKFRDRLPRMEKGADGISALVVEGWAPLRFHDSKLEAEDDYRAKMGSSKAAEDPGSMKTRIADLDRDGIEGEVVFPNGAAVTLYWTCDPLFAQAQSRAYNDWAVEVSAPYRSRIHIAPCISVLDVDAAVAEIERVAKMGFDLLTFPISPYPDVANSGPLILYNDRRFERLWAAAQDVDLTMTFHVGTRGNPQLARGPGGAVINRQKSHDTMTDPIVTLCASGILDRFPKLRFVAVEGGIGWIPCLLDLMDETYLKHHMWVRPKLKHGLPSEYFRAHGGATYQEDRAGVLLAEPYNLTENFLWANDYPHHEGTFPHSAAAIEREMGGLKEESRAKLLGLNAARLFKFEVPQHFRD